MTTTTTMSNTTTIQASKWNSLIKWIKETKGDEDTDIWEKLEELGVSSSGEEKERPKCVWFNDCGGLADYKTLNGKIDGTKSESWGKKDTENEHLFYWNLCSKCFKEESGLEY